MSLKPLFFCANCQKAEEIRFSKFLTCLNCYTSKYCDKNCQTEHYSKHEFFCKKMETLKTYINPHRRRTCHYPGHLYKVAQAYFEYAEQFHDYFAYQMAFVYFKELSSDPRCKQTYYVIEYLIFIMLSLNEIRAISPIFEDWIRSKLRQLNKDYEFHSDMNPFLSGNKFYLAVKLALEMDDLIYIQPLKRQINDCLSTFEEVLKLLSISERKKIQIFATKFSSNLFSIALHRNHTEVHFTLVLHCFCTCKKIQFFVNIFGTR